jgi:glycosyltransferase involved in cell wall biosynthesis
MGPIENPPWGRRLGGLKWRLSLGELEDYMVFSPGLFWRLLRFRPDVVIVEDLGGLPNSLLAALYCRLWRKPYLVWGLGNVPQKNPSRLRRLLAWPIRFLYSGAAGFICYSRHAEKVYAEWGKPTFLAYNACLPQPTAEEASIVRCQIDERSSRDAQVIVTVGELKKQKRFDCLILAFARLVHEGAERAVLHIIGNGPERAALEALAVAEGVGNHVIFHGAVYDVARKRALIAKAQLGVLPGRGGLVIQEFMQGGLPVISGAADGTERDNLISGYNGYLLENSASVEELVTVMREFLSLSPAAASAMAHHALDHVIAQYNLTKMVSGVKEAVDFCTSRRDGLAGFGAQ